MVSDFGVVLLAVDDYPDPPGPLPSSVSATRFGQLVCDGRGGRVLDSVVATSEHDVVERIRRWATDRDRPMASVVYFVGHGRGDGLDHEFLVPGNAEVVPFRTARLAEFLQHDWQYRQTDPASWTLFVLDCCDSELGVNNIMDQLGGKYPKKPKRLGLWPVAPGGAARVGAFADAFERALDMFTENDEHIPLDALFRKIRGELGDLESVGFLPDDAALIRRGPPMPVVMPLDVHAELQRVFSDRPPEVRSHFLARAVGGEIGEVAWHFTGRDAETAELCTWLHSGSGMKVVTGEPGSGKSALLGQVLVLADAELVDLYAKTGFASHLATGPRPPDAVFAAVVHLTGKTALETVHDIAAQLGISPPGESGQEADQTAIRDTEASDLRASIEAFLRGAQAHDRHGATVLVDALDESQDPEAIASFLHAMAVDGGLRLLVGTRRSLAEGPDEPADPSRRELLDALRVDDNDVLVVERDPAAMRAYAERRLLRDGSPYADLPSAASVVADRIATPDQPFLFARLATAELLARPVLDPDDGTLSRLLDREHRGVFAAALARIADADPEAFTLLDALAHARGRGMPSTGGIWVDAARAVGEVFAASDARVEATMMVAAPYITMDAEAGQSTYRLAHQTFVEHFKARPGYSRGHRRIAAALIDRFEDDPERWVTANHYAVRYLPEHLVADADPDIEGLAALVTDAGWLMRAVSVLGVDRSVEVIEAALSVWAADAQLEIEVYGGVEDVHATAADTVDTVARTLRRSRIALARDPGQLPGLLHARLKDEDNSTLATLGTGCGQITGQPWLRMIEGDLDWQADLEATYSLVGKVRALAFGEVDDECPVVAIAVDNRIELWDPRRAVHDEAATIHLGDHRATAVAIDIIGDRDVVVTSAGYEGVTEVWDASTGDRLAGAKVGLGHTLTVGRIGDRLVIAGAHPQGEVSLLDAKTLKPIEPHEQLRHRNVRAFAVNWDWDPMADRVLVALTHVVQDDDNTHRIAVVNATDGTELWRSVELDLRDNEFDAVAGGYIGSTFTVVSTCRGDTFWLTDDDLHVEESAHGGQRVRALAIGSVGGEAVVALAPDYDDTAVVELHQVDDDKAGGVAPRRSRLDIGTLPSSWTFDDEPGIDELFPGPKLESQRGASGGYQLRSFPVDRPEEWRHTALARGVLNGQPVVATGSVEGSAWVWDVTGDRPRSLAGPFATVSEHALRIGWNLVKPPVPTADSVALGHHPDHGPIVAVACDGEVALYTVPAGRKIESPAADSTVIDAVDLGQVNGRDLLITGSRGGVLAVWGLSPPERLAVLTLDNPIIDVRVVADTEDRQIAARTGTGQAFAFELIHG